MPGLGQAIASIAKIKQDNFTRSIDTWGPNLSEAKVRYIVERLGHAYGVFRPQEVLDKALLTEGLVVTKYDPVGVFPNSSKINEGAPCCGQTPAPAAPSLVKKIVNYSISISKWIMAGRKMRTDDRVNEIALICKSNKCGFYKEMTCLKCGCPVRSVEEEEDKTQNKIRLATEVCPVGLWS